MKWFSTLLFLSFLLFFSCKNEEKGRDATGTFEATEIIVSAEANGKILQFEAEEGSQLKKGQSVAKIEVASLELQKQQVEASINAIGQKRQDAGPKITVLTQQMSSTDAQVATLETQMSVLQKEQTRIANLFKGEAATQQQVDQIDGQIEILQKQIEAAKTQKTILQKQIESAKETVAIANRGLTSERAPLKVKVAQIEDQMGRGEILNPIDGTILTKYAHAGEFVNIGKPLYKLADLKEMILRAYITGDQLGELAIGQTVNVFIDQDADTYKTYEGKVSWIADKAEFTPKTIQTKNERANLVYAVKIKVPNDGFLKIGMYGEVDFVDKSQDNE